MTLTTILAVTVIGPILLAATTRNVVVVVAAAMVGIFVACSVMWFAATKIEQEPVEQPRREVTGYV